MKKKRKKKRRKKKRKKKKRRRKKKKSKFDYFSSFIQILPTHYYLDSNKILNTTKENYLFLDF
jgi:hypothetical protein